MNFDLTYLSCYEFVVSQVGGCMNANGPAIWGGCVTRRPHRAGSWYPAVAEPENCHGARRVWRGFCRPGTSFVSYTSVAVQS